MFLKRVHGENYLIYGGIDCLYLSSINNFWWWCLVLQEFPTDIDIDPFTLPEVHEHMIRSPPPVNWPKSPNFRMFQFPGEDDTLQVEVDVSTYM